jgi:hypothetical protein
METVGSRGDNASSQWLLWPGTVRLASVAAVWWSLVLLILFGMKLFPELRVWAVIQQSTALEAIFAPICAGGVLAGIFLIVAVLWYWARLDPSRKAWKLLWFLSFLCGWIGIPIYALLVYRKQALASGVS